MDTPNYFIYPFSSQVSIPPIAEIYMQVDRYHPDRNHVDLRLCSLVQNAASFGKIDAYFARFQPLGAELKFLSLPSFAREVFEGLAHKGDRIPFISIPAEKARDLFESLFQNGDMSSTNRADIENGLRELESSLRRANGVRDEITQAQKDLIQSFVQPFIEVAKEVELDRGKLLLLITTAAYQMGPSRLSYDGYEGRMRMHTCCPEEYRELMKSSLYPYGDIRRNRSKDFFDAVFNIARVYAGLGNLESALEQTGSTVPSLQVIQRTIVEELH